ncbi:DUF6343 family protein [Streptomyces alkaliterrae]|uniref:Uncharacterized protein n=1 Tax=Streptomyces alkaliterrae TaxID=2213162 RepID=A0A7W3WIE4_9ACTN|nr:DUF6343 family protein [Streptomyces alkaliterrae]MBB1252934.1 hypothetical protein [Streptomyces alkaliterrae]MBB1258361.1 hypothetical protein [Streptomyces alkaliterrae]
MQDRPSGRRPGPDPDREGILGRLLPRTGTEPLTARSALRLRLILSVLFAPLFVAGAVLFWIWSGRAGPQDVPSADSLRVLAWISTALAVFAVLDLLVVLRRISHARQAGRYPDGPGTR